MSISVFSRFFTRRHDFPTQSADGLNTRGEAAPVSRSENADAVVNAPGPRAGNLFRRGTAHFFQQVFRRGGSSQNSPNQNGPAQHRSDKGGSKLFPFPFSRRGGRFPDPASAAQTDLRSGIRLPTIQTEKAPSSESKSTTTKSHLGDIGIEPADVVSATVADAAAANARLPTDQEAVTQPAGENASLSRQSPERESLGPPLSDMRSSPVRTLDQIPEEIVETGALDSNMTNRGPMSIEMPPPLLFPPLQGSAQSPGFSTPPTQPGAADAAYMNWPATAPFPSQLGVSPEEEAPSVLFNSQITPSTGVGAQSLERPRSSYFFSRGRRTSGVHRSGVDVSPQGTNATNATNASRTFGVVPPGADAAYPSLENQPLPTPSEDREADVKAHSDEVIAKMVSDFDVAYQGQGISESSLKTMRTFYTRLIKANPSVAIAEAKPQNGAKAAEYVLNFTGHDTAQVPLRLNRTDASPLVLARIQADLVDWEKKHQPDDQKILAAYELMVQAQEGKRNEMPSKERRKLLSQAKTTMLEGLGIDKATWDRTKKRIGIQGMSDIYDGFAHLAITTSVLAAISTTLGPVIPEEVSKATKYISTWISNVVLNALSQIGLDSLQDGLVLKDGMPAADRDVANAPRLVDLRARMSREINEINELLLSLRTALASAGTADGRHDIDLLLNKLDPRMANLEKMQLDYRRRIATGQIFIKKYTTQLPFRLFVSTPAIVVANVLGTPAAGLAASVGALGVQTYLARIDEVIKNRHIIRSNLKYADYVAINPDTNQAVVDKAKARSMWAHPVDVMQNAVAMVYTEKLAEYHNEIRKLRKHLKSESVSAKQKKLAELIAKKEKKVEILKQDIGWFRAGVEGIRDRRHGAEFTRLSPDGVIAKMLKKPGHFVWELTRARSKIPLEIVVQAVDRAAGLATTRTLGFVGVDTGNLNKEIPTPFAAESVAQLGAYASFSWTNIVAKWNKAKVNRPETRPARQATSPEDHSEIKRKARVGRRQFFKDGLTPFYEIRIPNTDRVETIDIQNTGAWYKATTSRSERYRTAGREFLGRTALSIANAFDTPVQTLRTRRTYKKTKSLNREIRELYREHGLERQPQPRITSENPRATADEARMELGDGAPGIGSALGLRTGTTPTGRESMMSRRTPSPLTLPLPQPPSEEAPVRLTGDTSIASSPVDVRSKRQRSLSRPASTASASKTMATSPSGRSTAEQVTHRMARQAQSLMSAVNGFKVPESVSSIGPRILEASQALLPRLPSIEEDSASSEDLDAPAGATRVSRLPPKLELGLMDAQASISIDFLAEPDSESSASSASPNSSASEFLSDALKDLQELIASHSVPAVQRKTSAGEMADEALRNISN